MTTTRLDAEHADCLRHQGLIERARRALPVLQSRLSAKSAEVAIHAHDAAGGDERRWAACGGREAYAEELSLRDDVATLERLVAGAQPDSWHGWLRRADVDRILARAGLGTEEG